MKAYYVDSAAVRSNLQILKKHAGSAVVWAVLKGNGYGLGLLPMAELCRQEGIDHFAVTEVSDVMSLRQNGFEAAEILMLRPTTDQQELEALTEAGAILTLSGQDDLSALSILAQKRGVPARVHIKIDTGMGRYGFLPEETDKLLPIFQQTSVVQVEGIYTHLHSAFGKKKATYRQAEAFQGVLAVLDSGGCSYGMAHMLNSCGLLRFSQYVMGGVRVGSAILGRVGGAPKSGLKNVCTCEATVEELRWIAKGQTCGYGAGWTAKKPTRIAIFSVGWRHGFGLQLGEDLTRFRDRLRIFSGSFVRLFFPKPMTVTVNGKRCRVCGHVGMLHTVVDVTNINCALGDKAVFPINPIMLKGIPIIYR